MDHPHEIIEFTNEHGFTDLVFADLPDMPICANCHRFKMPNRGGGTCCDECNWEIEREMMHDYEQGFL